MKGKNRIKIILPMLIGMLAFACIALCLPIGKMSTSGNGRRAVNAVYNPSATSGTDQVVSAKFGGDVLFSVEKVYTGTISTNTTTFKTADGDTTFGKITNGDYAKYVVEDNSFVMLNNIYDGAYHIQDNANVQEAILVSLGNYVLTDNQTSPIKTNNDTYTTASGTMNYNAGITYLDIVTATRNETDISSDFKVRSVNNGNTITQDLMLEITQSGDENHEGYYFFTFNYLVGGVEYTESFGFYLIFNTSYTETKEVESLTYTAQPTLYLNGNTLLSGSTFCVGKDGIDAINSYSNYPTLSFDYTRYHISYTHTANRKVTKYDLQYIEQNNKRKLVLTGSNSDGTFERTFDINYYDATKNANIATLLLTEMGTYQFTYSYIYVGYSATDANLPEMNLASTTQSLVLHGFETMYSKVNFAGAELKYLKLVYNDGVDLIVPNGYNYDYALLDDETSIDTLKNQKLDFCYSFEINNTTYKNYRNGTIIETASQDPLLNSKLKRLNYYADLCDNAQLVAKKTELEPILNSISETDYVKTNQGSVWFEYNDDFDADSSFYFYSASKLTADNLFDGTNSKAVSYTNTTSFNKTGYYLVFIKLKYDTNSSYYQIFAFRYATSTIDIEVTDANSKIIGAGGYTNTSVTVSWKNPDIFEKKLTAYLYTSKNVNLTSTSEFKNPSEISNNVTVGADVEVGNFVQYMVTIKSEGENTTSKIFTIDKQPITDVKLYAVTKNATVDGKGYYKLALDKNNKNIEVKNAITDSFATLDYADKASGAGITASYSFAQFVTNGLTDDTHRLGDTILTEYKLGSVVENLTDYLRRDSGESVLKESNVLTDQGIYLFTLKDVAGNSCQYMFVIDKTEAYLEITKDSDKTYASNESLIFTKDVSYDFGTYKGIKVTTTNSTFKDIITNKTFPSDYYTQDSNTNKTNIQNLFAEISGDTYLKVKNLQLKDVNIKTSTVTNYGMTGTLSATDGVSSYYHLYLFGENNRYSGTIKEDLPAYWMSYVNVEINPDNSQGYVYSSLSGTLLDLPNGEDSANAFRLYTGSSLSDENTEATSADYAYFVCKIGTGTIHKIDTLTYKFYSLNIETGCYTETSSGILYENNSLGTGVQATSNDRLLYKFGVTKADAGLYVVTRTYEQAATGLDTTTKNYYFIVDRNGVYTTNNSGSAIIGKEFAINLLGGSTTFDDFEKTSTNPSKFTYEQDGFEDEKYYITLSTNKLPATITIPQAKYYNLDSTSETLYSGNGWSGQLNVKLYFKDTNGQIENDTNTITKIFDSTEINTSTNYKFATTDSNGNFAFSIAKYLKAIKGEYNAYYQKLIANSNYENWISLTGTYILVVQDNVVDIDDNNHQYIIAFKIEKDTAGPTLDIKEGFADAGLTTAEYSTGSYKYAITTNKDVVTFDIAEYDANSYSAQVDTDYIVVKKSYNGYTTNYINYYKDKEINNGTKVVGQIDNENVVVSNGSGWTITLPTTLTNLSDKLIYTITIRYRLKIGSNPECAMSAYYYYDTYDSMSRVKTYECTYTITIDRKAPSKNVDNLISKDDFIADYFGTKDVFENAVHLTGAQKAYTYQYKEYYESVANSKTDKSKIYAFRVGANTTFNRADESDETLVGLYVRGLSELNLPADKYSFEDKTSYLKNTTTYPTLTYSNILGTNGYYEILEFDLAGNYAQYVVYYESGVSDVLVSNFNATTPDSPSTKKSISMDLIGEKDASVYSIEKATTEPCTQAGDKYYKISIGSLQLNTIVTLCTYQAYEFGNLTGLIASTITNNGFGNYYVQVSKRSLDGERVAKTTITNYINYLDKESIASLNIDNIYYVDNSGNYHINLAGANIETDAGTKVYAESIVINCNGTSTTYELNDRAEETYVLKGNTKEVVTVDCETNVTYILTITDTYGNSYTKRFSTGGLDPYYGVPKTPESRASEGDHYEYSNNIYYTFTDVEFYYSLTFDNVKVVYTRDGNSTTKTLTNDGTNNSVTGIMEWSKIDDTHQAKLVLLAQDDEEIKFVITITENEIMTYVIDRQFGTTTLVNSTTGGETDLGVQIDKDWKTVNARTASVGIFNLTFSKKERDEFTYKYVLHCQKTDATYVEVDLTDKNKYVIATEDEYTGVYKFEIQVYAKTNQVYLGNKVYAFEVRQTDNQLYYVRDNYGTALKANSSFKFEEVTMTGKPAVTANCPLYVVNQNLSYANNNIVTIDDDNIVVEQLENVADENLTIYVVKVGTDYSLYFGILYVAERESLTSNLKLNDTNSNALETNQVITGKKSDAIKLTGSYDAGWKGKNLLQIDVYYGDDYSYVCSKAYGDGNFEYSIGGNGSYHLQLRDLAGNIHMFEDDNEYLSLFILREVTVYINDEVSVDSAYYNGEVNLKIYGAAMYDTGTIKVTSTLNGKAYSPKYNGEYLYKDCGTYNVTVVAKYNGVEYSKTVQFTIINANEAYKMFDLSVLAPYNITKVLSPTKENITTYFTTNIIERNNLSGMIVEYENLIEDEILNLVGGKSQFEITYQTKDKIYPTRSITLSLTFNNEEPKIDCSLNPGESTKKSFDIKFNPGVIYDQVGECYIMINDKVIYSVDSTSGYEIVTQTRTYKEDGDGDYYIKLTSSSGAVLNSFKVTIKEPLNSFAIIIIVVVSMAVAGVAITIFVLRHKMKIR